MAISPFVSPAVGGGVGTAVGFATSEALSQLSHPWGLGDVLFQEIEWIGREYHERGHLRGPRRGHVPNTDQTAIQQAVARPPWDTLTSKQQMAWTILGWTARTWAANQPPPSEQLAWNELSDREKNAAHGGLGLTEETWPERESSWQAVSGNAAVPSDETVLYTFANWDRRRRMDPPTE